MTAIIAAYSFYQTLVPAITVAGICALHQPALGSELEKLALAATVLSGALGVVLQTKNAEPRLHDFVFAAALGVSTGVLAPLFVLRVLRSTEALIRLLLN